MIFFFDENNRISPHTIKKFELISEYVKTWVQKLMNYPKCKGIVYIDCMSNSGVYYDEKDNEIEGTPIRVANIISHTMKAYPEKQAFLFFNDIEQEKIDLLNYRLPGNTENFHIQTSVMDGNQLLRNISSEFRQYKDMNFLLVYDPYQATIDWKAIAPFLRSWSEVIINHMVSDTIRAAKVAKRSATIEKYESTYLTDIENLVQFGSNKDAFENRIEQIIHVLSGRRGRRYYVAAFPFFNQTNSVVYNLIHCTSSLEGFKLYKRTAWKVFGDKSSTKDTHGVEKQLVLDFFDDDGVGFTTPTDKYCYNLNDIAVYIQNKYKGQRNVPLKQIWLLLDEHPVFPSDGYRLEIKNILKENYGAKESKGAITFSDRRG